MSSTAKNNLEAATKPRKPRLKAGPIKHGQYLLNKPQMLELCGNPSYSTVWLWMKDAGFPHPLELGPAGGRTSRVCWLAGEVYAWLEARPRRAIGNLKQTRAAQETKGGAPKRPARQKKNSGARP
jgi:predicted DNA-binding transcriptional regulator AlpA